MMACDYANLQDASQVSDSLAIETKYGVVKRDIMVDGDAEKVAFRKANRFMLPSPIILGAAVIIILSDIFLDPGFDTCQSQGPCV